MAIAFFNYLSSNLSRKLNNCKNIDEVIDVCVDNFYEFHSLIKLVHDSPICNLKDCQVKLLCNSLGNYLENNVRRSNRLLRWEIVSLSLPYPTRFKDCIFILKRGIVTVLPNK